MSNIFNKLAKPGTAPGGEGTGPRLILAVFGKHPGWDDHLPGIGIDNETLASIKQGLYVNGIGRQIDSGAWEKLEAEKRQDGFDHTFVWLLGGHAVLGRLLSSKDGKGRTKYPFVLCVDSEPGSVAFLLNTVRPGVESLSNACKSAVSAEQVATHARVGQQELNKLAETNAGGIDLEGLQSDRQRFLNHAALGPDRMGMLRVLHEISAAFALPGDTRLSGRKATVTTPSVTMRVPLAADSQDAALLLWSSFFRSILFPSIPLALFARAHADWLDVTIGEPKPDDFFFLQASRKAIPLATEVPYELAPNARQRLDEIESQFVGEGPGGTMIIRKPSSPTPAPPPPAIAPSPAPPPAKPSPPPPASTSPPASSTPEKARSSSGGKIALAAVVIVLLMVAGGAVFLYSGRSGNQKAFEDRVAGAKSLLKEKKFDEAIHQAGEAAKLHPEDAQVKQIIAQAKQELDKAALEEQYLSSLKRARAAFIAGDITTASQMASKALSIKPNDADARALRDQAQTKLNANAGGLKADADYKVAMGKGREALGRDDSGEAIKEAAVALQSKPNDKDALQLQASARISSEYKAAMDGARAALAQNNFAAALESAGKALSLKPKDGDAAKLLEQARLAQTAGAANEANYKSAMQDGAAALSRNEFATASASAAKALSIKANDADAVKLRDRATRGLAELVAVNNKEANYQSDIKDGRAAMARGDYAGALAKADAALAIKPNDPDAKQVHDTAEAAQKTDAEFQADMGQGRDLLAKNDRTHALAFALEALKIKPQDAGAKQLYNEARRQLGLKNEPQFYTNSIGMEFVWFDGLAGGGRFVGKYDVTEQQFKAVVTEPPSYVRVDKPNLPVVNVTFQDASQFCDSLSKRENKRYTLLTMDQWLSLAGLTAEQAQSAGIWQILSDSGALAREVTSLNKKPALTSPSPVGSSGAQTNGVYDVLGNVREWLATQQRAGFSYQSDGIERKGMLVLPQTFTDRWLQQETGFRCILSENSSP